MTPEQIQLLIKRANENATTATNYLESGGGTVSMAEVRAEISIALSLVAIADLLEHVVRGTKSLSVYNISSGE